eukprot:c21602_g1_i1 orf=134-3388(+)
MASSPSQNSLQKNPLSPPPAAPGAAAPSRGGEFLLQLLQQGRPSSVFSSVEPDCSSGRTNHISYGDGDALTSRHHSSSSSSGGGCWGASSFSRASSMEVCVFEEQARIHPLSRASSLEASVCEDEQARIHLQQDPAVAAMGPSHRAGEVCSIANSGININGEGRGILPFHDGYAQHHHHLGWQQVSPFPPFDVGFLCPPPSEHMLSPPLDPLFRTGPNQFSRPYLYSHFPVMDHYPRVPPPSFPNTGLVNPNRLEDMTGSFPYSAFDQPKAFPNPGTASGPNVACNNILLLAHRSVADKSAPLTEQGLASPKSQFYTQFGSIGVEFAHQSDSRDFASYAGLHASPNSSLFQQPSPLKEGVGVLPSPLGTKGIVVQSLSPVGPLKGDKQPLSVDFKESTEIFASSGSHAYQKCASEPVCAKSSTFVYTDSDEKLLKGPASPMGSATNVPQVAEVTRGPSNQKANVVANHIGATDSINKVSDGEISLGNDCESKPRPKGPQKDLDLLRKGAKRNGSGHWVAVKDKKEDAAMIGMESMSAPEESVSKTSDEVRRQRGQNQGWRLKPSNAGNHALWQSPDVSVVKSLDLAKRSGRSKSKSSFQQDPVGFPSGTKVDSAPSSATEQSKQALQTSPYSDSVGSVMVEGVVDSGKAAGSVMVERVVDSAKAVGDSKDSGSEENVETIIGCIGFLELDNDKDNDSGNDNDNDSEVGKETGRRNDLLGPSVCEGLNVDAKLSDTRVACPTKFNRRETFHRLDTEKCTKNFLSLFQTLIPPMDEEQRRKQLLATLDELVSGIWPEARLYLFGSCANSFGVCNSDIDVCLSVDAESSTKSEVVCTLADALKANHMLNVQPLTHARVPIVKYSDPATGISCDVCVNNMLAVVNTKLLHDYAQIDVRLRQLAFMVKHWAKCRQVNETYRGTLSSYAYVLMCIHFLQQRKPPVLPCLQEMEPTYMVTVGDIKCAYFDRVDRLKGFGQNNKETLADLVSLFFDYWAFRHNYSRTVISIRTGKFLSKAEKDWTRRIGNERHLICIEDPFEVSHDLGRVVDKHSIRVLREEFQRAARIMRQDANPCVALFEPYIRQKAQAA